MGLIGIHRLRPAMRGAGIAVMVAFLISGCASVVEVGSSAWDGLFGEEKEKGPAELMAEGIEKLNNGSYEAATEAFQELKDRYPYSRYALTAELKMADALFRQKEFLLAYDAYDEFERLHPKNQEIPYVIYQKGMSHFEQITTIDRDQTSTLKAKEEFERLIKRFPRSEYSARARKNIRKCLIYLAEYELYVGNYYFKRGNYQAALERYTTILQRYPDMGQYSQAIEKIRECREKITNDS